MKNLNFLSVLITLAMITLFGITPANANIAPDAADYAAPPQPGTDAPKPPVLPPAVAPAPPSTQDWAIANDNALKPVAADERPLEPPLKAPPDIKDIDIKRVQIKHPLSGAEMKAIPIKELGAKKEKEFLDVVLKMVDFAIENKAEKEEAVGLGEGFYHIHLLADPKDFDFKSPIMEQLDKVDSFVGHTQEAKTFDEMKRNIFMKAGGEPELLDKNEIDKKNAEDEDNVLKSEAVKNTDKKNEFGTLEPSDLKKASPATIYFMRDSKGPYKLSNGVSISIYIFFGN